MPTNFKPVYTINPAIARYLMSIEATKEKVAMLPVNPTVLASLREVAVERMLNPSLTVMDKMLSRTVVRAP